ncbi:hypothetical protein AU161_gp08 [Pseudomonas phage PPPL-1]|uniref:Uncharacterized protein n=1 Tax=Pseudomonas phage PPPL-1 TaxID=1755692 RepID=A0A0S2MVP6_9CAUD|nr:hypothetical protein AU161_gp08 [Pseudomonas phage PPPL-1]ALO79968.1 hypothetical protein PPPL1_008 [Pseudomonas phage PPPL-1]
MSAAKSVTFKVSRPDGHYGLHKIQDTVFSLGLGPCGRWVTSIEATVTESLLKVVQFSTDIDTTEAEQEMRESTSVIFGSAPAYYRTEKKLDAALVEFHKERYYRCRDILKKARDRSEIKEFVYKFSDVHGRIVIIR